MSMLMRASEIHARPIVTLGGEDVAQVKDIVYSAGGGAVSGFTLAGRGMLAGPLDRALPWRSVRALGGDAVMIADEDALTPLDEFLGGGAGHDSAAGSAEDEETAEDSAEGGESEGGGRRGGDVMGSQVLTDDGNALGKVVDVIVGVVESGDNAGGCDVVGYEIEPSEKSSQQRGTMLVPLPDTLAASGEHLIVPASARDFIRHDMAGFGAAVEEFRDHLKGQAR